MNVEANGLRFHVAEEGDGVPVLLLHGFPDTGDVWRHQLPALAGAGFRAIAPDLRGRGRSDRPEGVEAYALPKLVADAAGLLDALGVERAHVLGGCIGGPYCLGVVQAAPGRITAAVLQQPIGYDGTNRKAFYDMFDSWANELKTQRNDVDPDAWNAFRERMYGGDFLFNVDRDFVRRCTVPMLVLLGNDQYHPSVTSREIVELAPHAELVERWKEPEVVEATVARVRSFLEQHTPKQGHGR